MDEPLVVNDTVIASVGQYNDNLGLVSFVKKNGDFQFEKFELQAIDGSVKKNHSAEEKTASFKDAVNRKYFSKYGYEWDEVLAKNNVAFTKIEDFSAEQGEDTLGNIISDAYIYGVKKAEGKNYRTVDVAVAPSGVIRESFAKGDVTVEDAFNVLSLVPKDADGNVITDYEQHIIHRKDGSELKEWYALASYIDSFDGGKVPVKKYGELQGRKVQENTLNPFKLLKQTNKFFWMITAAVVLVLAVVALIVVLIVKLVRRMRYGKYGIRRKDLIFRR